MIPFVDRFDNLRLRKNGTYEPEIRQIIEANLKPGDVFVDVGAHIGVHTVAGSRAVGPTGKVYAFEPDPENYSILRKNIKALDLRNVEAVNSAVGIRKGRDILSLHPRNSADHRCYPVRGRKTIGIDMVTLDGVFENRTIRLLKNDTQGFEYHVLKGGQDLLGRGDVEIIVEFYPRGLWAAGKTGKEFFLLLKTMGFRAFVVTRHAGLVPADEEKILANCTPLNGRFVNLFCTRKTRPEEA